MDGRIDGFSHQLSSDEDVLVLDFNRILITLIMQIDLSVQNINISNVYSQCSILCKVY